MESKSWMSSACRLLLLSLPLSVHIQQTQALTLKRDNLKINGSSGGREVISLNTEWRFWRSEKNPDNLIYDNRTDTPGGQVTILKPWVLPAANDFIKDAAKHYEHPTGNPGGDVEYVQSTFDDASWETVTLPHDWAVKGPFYQGDDVPVKGGMGRLPVHGVGWYRRKIDFTSADQGKIIYLDIEGAQSYAVVWLNGNFVGGWPYGYNSFRLDLTPYLKVGQENQLAIRLDNPIESSRWYPGGGIYRNVWLTKVESIHVVQWGTYITSKVTAESAAIDLAVQVANKANSSQHINVETTIHIYDPKTGHAGEKVAAFPSAAVTVAGGQKNSINSSVTIQNPRLWGPPPTQQPNLYVAVTRLVAKNGESTIDTYETRFGIRTFTYSGDEGLLVNGERISIRGVNQHHDLGALGGAFNVRAAERQLEVLHDLGANAVRMSHNPPSPELLDLTDRMGFLVMDEIFDCWERKKTDNDYHLLFTDWHEADLRSFMRRDRNHPSIYSWSFGNEVGEQSTGDAGAAIGKALNAMMDEEDPTRPSTASMNLARPNMSFPQAVDILSLNYQGEGIRDTPEYSYTSGSRTPPQYQPFHDTFPDKLLASSESAAALSTRGTYIFPVTSLISAPVNDSSGGNSTSAYVSSYELHSSDFGSSADKVFSALDRHPFVAGEFVWSGWDYLGEPTPYYSARSSYFGIIDLAGFKKDRYFLYQSRWRPDLKMAHILPHWNWPERRGKVTPVHVFTAADEAELFVNGKSQGRKKRAELQYRFRWDNVTYEPGELHVTTFKQGQAWANDTVRTTGEASRVRLIPDRKAIQGDGKDLSFITLEVLDGEGEFVRNANNAVSFSISGPGQIVATDNGDPTDFTVFPSKDRKTFNGLALAIVKANVGASGAITITASGPGLESASITIEAH